MSFLSMLFLIYTVFIFPESRCYRVLFRLRKRETQSLLCLSSCRSEYIYSLTALATTANRLQTLFLRLSRSPETDSRACVCVCLLSLTLTGRPMCVQQTMCGCMFHLTFTKKQKCDPFNSKQSTSHRLFHANP